MKIIVSYSGGKDSHACLVSAVNQFGADKVTAVFCDTGWEHPLTLAHIDETTKHLGVELVTLHPVRDFVELARHKKRFPSTKARFCTFELKIKPMIDYVLSLKENCIIIQGIRAKESASRAAMAEECMYFAEYFTPRANGKKDSYRGQEVRKWCRKYDASVSRPIFSWTAQDVIDCILAAGMRPNPLYERGCSRVGCYPCIMCRQSEVKILMKDELMKNRLVDAENSIDRSFFPPDYIPKRFCANGHYPTVDDVFKYVSGKDATLDMFEPEGGYACMSLYHGLCE